MGRFGALRDPRFRRLFAGQALSGFGDSALYLTLGIWAKTLTGSNAAAGGVFLALAAPTLFAPLAGHLTDRVQRKTLLIVVNAITALIVLSLVFVRSRDELWLIYVVAFCYGTSFDLLSAAGSGLRKDMLAGCDNAGMSVVAQTAVVLAGLVHVLIFAMESLLFTRVQVYQRFRTRAEDVAAVQQWAFNQGWYNLFLAAGAIGGVITVHAGNATAGRSVALFSCACMLGAAVVLMGSDRRMLRGALIQGVLPLVALLAAIAF